MNKAFYTTEEARLALGLSNKTIISEYIKQGFLRAIKVSGAWLVDADSLESRVKRLKVINKNMRGV